MNTPHPVNKMRWSWEFGPASILTIVGVLVQAGVVIWAASSIYTGLTKQVEAQSVKIEQVEKGSHARFSTVQNAIEKSNTLATQQDSRLTKLETAITYIGSQISGVEKRLDGISRN